MRASCEPHVSIIGCESHVLSLALEFQYLEMFLSFEFNSGFSLFAGHNYIDGTDSTVPFNLWKTIATFIDVNKKQQVHLTGNHSAIQNFSSEMVSKRARRSRTTEIISCFLRFGPPWVCLVCTRIMLDIMHQYGLRSPLHLSYSRKRLQRA